MKNSRRIVARILATVMMAATLANAFNSAFAAEDGAADVVTTESASPSDAQEPDGTSLPPAGNMSGTDGTDGTSLPQAGNTSGTDGTSLPPAGNTSGTDGTDGTSLPLEGNTPGTGSTSLPLEGEVPPQGAEEVSDSGTGDSSLSPEESGTDQVNTAVTIYYETTEGGTVTPASETVTVSFDAEGNLTGTGTPAGATAAPEAGFVFAGWEDENGAIVSYDVTLVPDLAQIDAQALFSNGTVTLAYTARFDRMAGMLRAANEPLTIDGLYANLYSPAEGGATVISGTTYTGPEQLIPSFIVDMNDFYDRSGTVFYKATPVLPDGKTAQVVLLKKSDGSFEAVNDWRVLDPESDNPRIIAVSAEGGGFYWNGWGMGYAADNYSNFYWLTAYRQALSVVIHYIDDDGTEFLPAERLMDMEGAKEQTSFDLQEIGARKNTDYYTYVGTWYTGNELAEPNFALTENYPNQVTGIELKQNGSWQFFRHFLRKVEKQTVSAAAGDVHIYMVYRQNPKGGSIGTGGSSAGGVLDIPEPKHEKTVVKNAEEPTYDLTLTIKGEAGSETNKTLVDVLFVIDKSPSISNAIGMVRNSVNQIQNTLSANQNLDVQYAVTYFASFSSGDEARYDAYRRKKFTSYYGQWRGFSSEKITVNTSIDTSGDQFTNYQAAFRDAKRILNTARPEARKIVIFLTDGVPVRSYINRNGYDVRGEKMEDGIAEAAGLTANDVYGIGFNMDGPERHEISIYNGDRSESEGFWGIPKETVSQLDVVDRHVQATTANNKRSFLARGQNQLNEVFRQIAAQVSVIDLHDVHIKDQLNPYAFETLDESGNLLKLAIQVWEGDTLVKEQVANNVPFNGSKATTSMEIEGATLVAAFDKDSRNLTLDFPEDYALNPAYTYKVVMTIEPSTKAYREFADNAQDYVSDDKNTYQGEAGTGTHAGEDGYKSNVDETATVSYKYGDMGKTLPYDKPVIQTRVKSASIEKIWEEGDAPVGERPGSVTFTLQWRKGEKGAWTDYLNSNDEKVTVTLTQADAKDGNPDVWFKQIDNLPARADRKWLFYRFVEPVIADYTSEAAYTFGADLDETKITNRSDELNPTKLTIKKVDENGVLIENVSATFALTKDGGQAVTKETVKGIVEFEFKTAADQGIYTLKETASPVGYQLAQGAEWRVTVSRDGTVTSVQPVLRKTWNLVIDVNPNSRFDKNTLTLTVENPRLRTKIEGKKTFIDGGKTHNYSEEVKLTLYRYTTDKNSAEEVSYAKSAVAVTERDARSATLYWTGDKYVFVGLEQYDTQGNKYTYFVKEEKISDAYENPVYINTGDYAAEDGAAYDNGEIINELRQVYIGIDGKKEWVDGNLKHVNRDDVELTLYRYMAGARKNPETDTEITYKKVDSVENKAEVTEPTLVWTGNAYEFIGLEQYDADRNSYAYYVTETPVKGYDAPVYSGQDTTVAEDGDTITNPLTQAPAKLEGDKKWVDGGKDHDNAKEITLTLMRVSKDAEGNIVKPEETVSFTVFDGVPTDAEQEEIAKNLTPVLYWEGNHYTFIGLEQFDEARFPYTYYVTEAQVNGYKVPVYESTDGVAYDGDTITNPIEDEDVELTGIKTWKDAPANDTEHFNKDEITLILHRMSKDAKGNVVNADETVTGFTPEWQGARYTFRSLPKYDRDGNTYTYWAVEVPVEGYNDPQYVNTNENATVTDKAYNDAEIINEEITVDKEVNNADHADLKNRDEVFTYKITTQIPKMTKLDENGNVVTRLTEFVITDALVDVLEFANPANVKVTLGGADVTKDVSVDTDNNVLTVDMANYIGLEHQGKTVIVTFKAQIKASVTDAELRAKDYVIDGKIPNEAEVLINNKHKVKSDTVTVTPPPEITKEVESASGNAKTDETTGLKVHADLTGRDEHFTYTIKTRIPEVEELTSFLVTDELNALLEIVGDNDAVTVNIDGTPKGMGNYVTVTHTAAQDSLEVNFIEYLQNSKGKDVEISFSAKIRDGVTDEQIAAASVTVVGTGVPNTAKYILNGHDPKESNTVTVIPPPEIEKTVAPDGTVTDLDGKQENVQGEATTDGKHADLAARHETFTYTVTTKIPAVEELKSFEVKDTLCEVLEIVSTEAEVKVTIDGADATPEVSISDDKKNLNVNFKDYLTEQYKGKAVVITYTAKLIDNLTDAQIKRYAQEYDGHTGLPNTVLYVMNGENSPEEHATVTPPPESGKTVANAEKDNPDDHHADLKTRDEIFTYTVTSEIPSTENCESYVIEDTLDKVLEFVPGTARITVNGTQVSQVLNADYAATGKLTAAFEGDGYGKAYIKAHAGEAVVITYSARIKADVTDKELASYIGGRIYNDVLFKINNKPVDRDRASVTPPPEIEKTVAPDGTTLTIDGKETPVKGEATADNKHADLAARHESFTYTVTTEMPKVTDLKSFVVRDELSEVLEFVSTEDAVTVTIAGIAVTPKVTIADKHLSVDFADYLDVKGEIVITYQAKFIDTLTDAQYAQYAQEYDGHTGVPNTVYYVLNGENSPEEHATVTPPPALDKTIKTPEGNYKAYALEHRDDVFTYEIKTAVPGADNLTGFVVKDDLAEVLMLVPKSVAVTIDGQKVTPDITEEGSRLTVDFRDYLDKQYRGKAVVITYSAQIRQSATYEELESAMIKMYDKDGIPNRARYEFNGNPGEDSTVIVIPPPEIKKDVNGAEHYDLKEPAEPFTYTITTKIPELTETDAEGNVTTRLRSFDIVDELEPVLTFRGLSIEKGVTKEEQNGTVEVSVTVGASRKTSRVAVQGGTGSVRENNYTVSIDGQVLTVSFDPAYIGVIANQGQEVKVSFDAQVRRGQDMTNYIVKGTADEISIPNTARYKLNNNPTESNTVTVTPPPELIDLRVEKSWEDDNNRDGLRPASVTFRLLADGTQLATVTLNAANNWTHTFTGLRRFALNGDLIEYTVREDAIAQYEARYPDRNAAADANRISYDADGTLRFINILNVHTPGRTQLSVIKIWADANNAAGIRPATITVRLLANGQPTGRTLVLSAQTGWSGSFNDLYIHENGRAVTYTVSEDAVANYTTQITANGAYAYTVTNTYDAPPPPDDEEDVLGVRRTDDPQVLGARRGKTGDDFDQMQHMLQIICASLAILLYLYAEGAFDRRKRRADR